MISEQIDTKTDKELYSLFLDGNNNAFNVLIKRHRKLLTHFLLNYVKNIETAEDIAQDSFMYMIVNKINYDFKYSFKTYLYTIAKSRALNYLKKSKYITDLEDSILDNKLIDDYNIEDEFIKKENNRIVMNAIRKLKKKYQIIINLHEFQGFKYKEICKILNISMPQTKMMIHRAKKSLKKIMEEENKNAK